MSAPKAFQKGQARPKGGGEVPGFPTWPVFQTREGTANRVTKCPSAAACQGANATTKSKGSLAAGVQSRQLKADGHIQSSRAIAPKSAKTRKCHFGRLRINTKSTQMAGALAEGNLTVLRITRQPKLGGSVCRAVTNKTLGFLHLQPFLVAPVKVAVIPSMIFSCCAQVTLPRPGRGSSPDLPLKGGGGYFFRPLDCPSDTKIMKIVIVFGILKQKILGSTTFGAQCKIFVCI